ncbi:aspartate-semialdehyde dehydrogenase [Methylacidiphilum caldifontis]|uniref:Aspartate-semialdehyde dehydrogenase n=1 Tax=Methylacidiphilum caldifontis TaxID=2795386 RepID=A0A4Y8PHD4_9BACT|nr:aspartate-semialdehyde dehydrogenase [Methylacidiphilum caldifontis]QSR88689.1 aspartate-semialdehyde dehydrogenase [Methylacidiphilum caldifontis]TFE73307.1 aspartate-semialdehyde dehydrogenase [Methylacidiphilum caldifontis]
MGLKLGIVGATGAVGIEAIKLLEKSRIEISELRLFASSRSVGKKISFLGEELAVQELSSNALRNLDFVFFSAGSSISAIFAPKAKENGAVVIDNSSFFRMKPEVPLVVPEVNGEDLKNHQGIIANPNCTTALLSVALWPIHKIATVERVIVSTYQAVSGAGAKALLELDTQVRHYVQGKPIVPEVFPEQIAFNVFSHNSPIAENGYNGEENKVIQELKKIFHCPGLNVCATCIRVPVFRAHCESVVVETARKITAEETRRILASSPGVEVIDDPQNGLFPTPIKASGKKEVLVGRIREDLSHPRSISFFLSGDQLLKGAAWNALQILQCLIN